MSGKSSLSVNIYHQKPSNFYVIWASIPERVDAWTKQHPQELHQ